MPVRVPPETQCAQVAKEVCAWVPNRVPDLVSGATVDGTTLSFRLPGGKTHTYSIAPDPKTMQGGMALLDDKGESLVVTQDHRWDSGVRKPFSPVEIADELAPTLTQHLTLKLMREKLRVPGVKLDPASKGNYKEIKGKYTGGGYEELEFSASPTYFAEDGTLWQIPQEQHSCRTGISLSLPVGFVEHMVLADIKEGLSKLVLAHHAHEQAVTDTELYAHYLEELDAKLGGGRLRIMPAHDFVDCRMIETGYHLRIGLSQRPYTFALSDMRDENQKKRGLTGEQLAGWTGLIDSLVRTPEQLRAMKPLLLPVGDATPEMSSDLELS